MKLYDFFDRKLIEEFTIKPEIKAMTQEERFALLNRLFKEEYYGKTVSFNMLEKELFVKTTAVTRSHFGFFRRGGSFNGYMAKLNISASGGYIPLISDCEYVSSSDEKKPSQNKFHRNTIAYHYFAKEILCDGERFRVQIDVRENKKHQFIVYGVEMSPVRRVLEAERVSGKNKRRELANSAPSKEAADSGGENAPARISSDGIVPQEAHHVKGQNEKNKKSLMKQIFEATANRRSPKARVEAQPDKNR